MSNMVKYEKNGVIVPERQFILIKKCIKMYFVNNLVQSFFSDSIIMIISISVR